MMRVKLVSISYKWEYTKVRAVTFSDYSRLILPAHVDFEEIIQVGKIYLLLHDRSTLTFLNSTGVGILKDNYLQISCPKIYLSKEEADKNKLQEGLFKSYQKIADYEKQSFEEGTWVEEDENAFRAI